jgi:hypothetical protein
MTEIEKVFLASKAFSKNGILKNLNIAMTFMTKNILPTTCGNT